MLTVHVGTDTYGRVKTVAGTPIVTKFAMFQFLPVYPLQSFYFEGAGPSETTGVPFLLREQNAAVRGVPLASVDKTSVVMAYARSLFATLVLLGAMLLVPAIGYFTGEQLDDVAMVAVRVLLGSLVVGILGGALTYIIPLTPHRENDIRRYCAERLGIAADPARVPPVLARMLVEHVDDQPLDTGNRREQWIHQLIATRARIAEAQAVDVDDLEAKTDRLLEELNHAERLRL